MFKLSIKKYKTVVYLLVIILFTGFNVLSISGDPFINDDETSNKVSYGSSKVQTIVIEDLILETNYTLIISNNTIDTYNISFLSTSRIAKIDFSYSGIKITRYNDSLTELQLILVEHTNNADIILFVKYLPISYNEFQEFVVWTIDLIIFGFTIFLGGIIVIALINVFK